MKSKKAKLKSGIYEHFKGKRYKVLFAAKHSERNTPLTTKSRF